MIPKVDEYLKLCVDTYDPETNQRTVRLPMLEDFALELGINDTTLVEWRKKYPEFSTACSKIEIEQKKKLANEALAGNYNPVIAKLHLAANHGMADKVDQDITSDGKPLEGLAVQFVDAKKDDSGSTTTN
jgi:hypothetical protein